VKTAKVVRGSLRTPFAGQSNVSVAATSYGPLMRGTRAMSKTQQVDLTGDTVDRDRAERAADLFQNHRKELGFVNRAQCAEKDLVTVERAGEVVGAALANHCVRKPQTTLYELAVSQKARREGIATRLVQELAVESPHEKIIAKCPADLPSNQFYNQTGWTLIDVEEGKNRPLCVWERAVVADSSEKQLTRTIRTDDARQSCPDCREDVGPTKGGQKVNGKITHGWKCDECNNVMPSNSGPNAGTFVDGWTAVKMQFRDGSENWVPVPDRYGGENQ